MNFDSIKLAGILVYNTVDQALKGPIKDFALQVATPANAALACGAVVAPLVATGIGLGINVFFARVLQISPAAPTELLPKGTWKVMNVLKMPGDILMTVIYTVVSVALPFLKKEQKVCLMQDYIGPVIEEIEYRWFVQEICLTVVPTLVVGALCPQFLPVLYSPAAKVARVVFSSAFFALSHTENWGEGLLHGMNWFAPKESQGVNSHFISGLLYGGMYAVTGSLYPGMAMHSIHNSAVTLFSKMM